MVPRLVRYDPDWWSYINFEMFMREMRPSVRKTTTLLRTIATSLRYAIDDGGVQARLSCRSAVSQACQSGSLCLKRALVGAYNGHTRVVG